ncbi:hypothetical protein [Geomicrobium sp. JCM 19039]|uniref:hypothetical protein n=1 Tax=Geomicrobium sp. JCM 19039 TaxID=1460636 RepID=UPI00045F40A5|nr:hypothetical protein [Geomicrobium sp. JCM 19039]GAK11353.1 hypothetical protein JCM19039_1042 [Geomicrobium sp. JCM 19039]
MYRREDVIPSRQKFDTQSIISKSGNSDVDVTVNVETTALAYALACFYYADGSLDREQYTKMLDELDHQFGKRGMGTSEKNYEPKRRNWLF